MATFGQTVGGASSDTWGNTSNVYVKATSTPGSNGVLSSISLYCSKNSGSPKVEVALYADDGTGDHPTTLLAGTEVGVSAGASAGFVQVPLVFAGIIAGTQYWLGFKVDSGVINAFYNNTNTTRYRGDGPRVWDNPASPTATIAEGISIFATYNTPAGHFQLEGGTGNISTETAGDFELEPGP